MADTIKATSDYSRFLLHEFNRDVEKTGRLEESTKKHGWISAYPMHVTQDGARLKIKAGHHRFTVARKLGIPVKYVICDDSANISIHELEISTNQWKLNDYLTSYCRIGNKNYTDVKAYHEKTGISLNLCTSLLAGSQAGSSNHIHKFKNGTYKTGDTKHADIIAHIVTILSLAKIKISTNNYFVNALSRALFVHQFKPEMFIDKALKNAAIMVKQPTTDRYMELIEEIYNYQARKNTRLSLVFLAKEAALDRTPIIKRQE